MWRLIINFFITSSIILYLSLKFLCLGSRLIQIIIFILNTLEDSLSTFKILREQLSLNPLGYLFFMMYFGLQDTKPPPCPLHLTKQGGSIHWSQFYLYTVCKLVLYISETITMHCIVMRTEAVYE